MKARIVGSAASTVIAAAGLWWLASRFGPSWTAVLHTVRGVSWLELVGLTVVWAAGLWCHSWVLTAALPGLSRRRALLLNLSGSAVADLLPFGAAAGAGLNLAMVRSWKFAGTAYASFTVIHNVWNVVAKLALPAVVLSVALLSGSVSSPGLLALAELALALTAGLTLAAVAAIADARAASALGRSLDRVLAGGWRLVGSARRTHLGALLPAIRRESATVIARGWPQLTAGVISYLVLQAVLWSLCLGAVGRVPAVPVLLAGFAVERALSVLPFTPGGAGMAEAGSIAVLVSLGGDLITTTAGVLLYRGFAFLLEIPVGGAGLAVWLWAQHRPGRAPAVLTS